MAVQAVRLLTPTAKKANARISIYAENTQKFINKIITSEEKTKKAVNYLSVIRQHSAGKEETAEQVLTFLTSKGGDKVFPVLGRSNAGIKDFGVRTKLFGIKLRSEGAAVLKILKKLAKQDKKGIHGFDRLVELCTGKKAEHVALPKLHRVRNYTEFDPEYSRKTQLIDIMAH